MDSSSPSDVDPARVREFRVLGRGSHSQQMTLMKLRLATITAALALLGLTTTAASRFPDPAVDAKATTSSTETAVLAGGCFWGVEARIRTPQRRRRRRLRLRRRKQDDRALRGRQHRHDRPRRVGADHIRPVENFLRPTAEGVFRRRPRSHQLNRQGPDAGTAVPLLNFLRAATNSRHRRGLHPAARRRQDLPADRSSRGRAARAASTPPRPITRTSSTTTLATRTSSTTTCPRSST